MTRWPGALVPKRRVERLWVVVAVAISIRIFVSLYMGDRVEVLPGIHDQVSYDALAHSLLSGHGYTFTRSWYPFIPANTPTAFWSFLYPLYLVGVYALFGPHPLAARLIQGAISGALTVWLVYRLGRRLFGKRIGLVAAALSAVYIYFIYYDTALMTESFYTLGVLAMLDVAMGVGEPANGRISESANGRTDGWLNRRIGQWLLLGVVLGLTTLLRQSILPWVPFLFLWLWWATRNTQHTSRNTSSNCRLSTSRFMPYVLRLTLTLLILAAFILPFTIRNYFVYGAFLPLNSNAGYALYSANHPDHGTSFMQSYAAPIPEDLRGLDEARLSSKLMGMGFRFILQEPGRYLLLTLSRVPIFFKFWPSPESHPLSNVSRVLSFGLYLPFFLYGLFLSRRAWRCCSLLYLFGIMYSLMHILTWASIRYRLVIDAAFMPFAALAVVDLAGRIHSRWQSRSPTN